MGTKDRPTVSDQRPDGHSKAPGVTLFLHGSTSSVVHFDLWVKSKPLRRACRGLACVSTLRCRQRTLPALLLGLSRCRRVLLREQVLSVWLTSHLSWGPRRCRAPLLPRPCAAIACWVSSRRGPRPLLGSAWAQGEEMLVQRKKDGQTRVPLRSPRRGGPRLLSLSGNVRDGDCNLSVLTRGGCPHGALPPGHSSR